MDEKKLIYCVDDEENIREVYSYALQGAGFDVERSTGTTRSRRLSKRDCPICCFST